MRTGSLKSLCICGLSKPDQVVQVVEELPLCTHLKELELGLYLLDKVRHVPFVRNASTVYCEKFSRDKSFADFAVGLTSVKIKFVNFYKSTQ